MRCWRWLALLLAGSALGWPARAQFTQFTPPGGLATVTVQNERAIEEAMANARWRLGAVRIDPWISVSDLAYVREDVLSATGEQIEQGEPDLTVTGSLGLRAFLRTGKRLYWAAHAIPEYVWWKDRKDERGWRGRYGFGAFFYSDRFTLEAKAARDEVQGIASEETDLRTDFATDRLALNVETRIAGAFSLAFSAQRSTPSYDRPSGFGPDFSGLGRREDALRATLRYRFPSRFTLGIGAEWTETRFDQGGSPLSNDGTAQILEASYDGPRFYVSAVYAERQLDPAGDSSFAGFDSSTGSVVVSLSPRGRLSPYVYWSRNLVYSIARGYQYSTADRYGVATDLKVGRRLQWRFFVEGGKLDFETSSSGAADRRDDFRGYGVDLAFQAFRRGSIAIGYVRTRYDSNLDAFDRELSSIQSRLNIGFGRPNSFSF